MADSEVFAIYCLSVYRNDNSKISKLTSNKQVQSRSGVAERRRRSVISDDKIGKYQLKKTLRSSTDRSVFLAYDPFLDRQVAIKVIQLCSQDDVSASPALDQFFFEARSIARLQHPNIVSIYDADIGDFEGYLVMEYIAGESLQSQLAKQDYLPTQQIEQIFSSLTYALAYAHRKGVVHRDIKPSNIMIESDGRTKLLDFGIADRICVGDEQEKPLAGSPSYMAPELFDAASPSSQSDIFALGVVLYQCLCGQLPFVAEQAHSVLYKILNESPIPAHEVNAKLVPSVSAVIDRALDKDPSQRYADAEQLFADLSVAFES